MNQLYNNEKIQKELNILFVLSTKLKICPFQFSIIPFAFAFWYCINAIVLFLQRALFDKISIYQPVKKEK